MTCPCGRSPDPGIKPGGGCWCSVADVAYYKVKGPNGYYRRRFETGADAEGFIRGLYSIDALNKSGKVMWTEGA